MRILYALAAAVLAAALFFAVFPTSTDAALYDDVLRLHVLANSDEDDDQRVKLAVRDAILEEVSPLLADCSDREEAAAVLRAALPALTQTADAVLADAGMAYASDAVISLERYPTRTYASAALPSGEYLSLRIVLGEGEGHNWWCVLFPPLCLSAAGGDDPEALCLEAGLTPEQYRLITATERSARYTVRFKLLEFLEELAAKLK